MLRYLKIILLAAGLLSFIQSNAEDNVAKRSKRIIKVLSYNIHHGAPEGKDAKINLDNIVSVIKMKDPDIVALQEVDKHTRRSSEDQAKVLAEKLGMYYFFSMSIDYQGGEYGVAILSKYPFIETERILLDKKAQKGEPRSLGIVTVKVPMLGNIRFASAHLDLVLENRSVQIEQLNTISKASGYPLIVAGDLNTTPDKPEITILKKEYQLSCKEQCDNTFPVNIPNRKIDYILLNRKATKKLKVQEYGAISGRLESDHLPLFGIYSF